ncbi:MAG: DNA polymerase III subunit beta [Phycisphaerae bacterium]|nr:DNA polymerase III subunit beta [Phycisphaerae bacterium]
MADTMKVVCDRAHLLDALTTAASVVAPRNTSPALACVKLTAKDGLLQIRSTDSEVAVSVCVPQVEVQKDGETLVPAEKLLQIVRASEDTTLTMELQGQALVLRGEDARYRIFGQDPKDFPRVPELPPSKTDFETTAESMRRLVARTLFATAMDTSRYAFNAVLIDRNGKQLRVVATDGRRLAVARGECSKGEGEFRAIVPTKTMNILNRLMGDPAAAVSVAREETRIQFRIGTGPDAAVLVSQLVEGTFPPFEDVIPKDHDKRISFDRDALGSAVRRAALLTNEESKGVRMSFGPETLVLRSRAPELGEAEITIPMEKYQGEPIEIGFNPSYLTDALKVVDPGEVLIELKAPNKPGVLRAGKEFTYVVMPVNLDPVG